MEPVLPGKSRPTFRAPAGSSDPTPARPLLPPSHMVTTRGARWGVSVKSSIALILAAVGWLSVLGHGVRAEMVGRVVTSWPASSLGTP